MSSRSYCATIIILAALALLLAACSERAAPTPTPTTIPPTATPIPPTPTPTPIPLSTWIDSGYDALARSDFAEAIDMFQRAATADPSYAPALVGLSTVQHWQIGDELQTLDLAEQAVELAPDSAEAQAALATARLDMYDVEGAVEAAERAAELDPSNGEVQATLAFAYLDAANYAEALEAAQKAVAAQPDSPAGYAVLGDYYWIIGDAARAQAAMQRAVDLQPEFAPRHVRYGKLLSAAGQYEQAGKAFDQALELVPDSTGALLAMAYVAMATGDIETAEACIDEVTALIPNAPQPYVAHGQLLRSQSAPDEARAQYRKALDRRENYPPALEGMGWTYLNEDECDLAVRQFQTLMAEQPQSSTGPVDMGIARMCDGDPIKALEYFRKAVRLDPYDEWAHIGLGDAFAAQERWDEALLAYAQALEVGISDWHVHKELGSMLMNQDETAMARSEFELALRLNPSGVENSSAHTTLSYLDSVDGRMDDAETHARTALDLDPKDSRAQLVLGMVLVEQDRTAAAVEILEPLEEEEPENSYAHLLLGLAYKGEGRLNDARKELETYVALDPYGGDDRMSAMIEALNEGYYLSEAEGLDAVSDYLLEEFEQVGSAGVLETNGISRTLVITLTAAGDQEPFDVYLDMAKATIAGAAYLDRIEPAVGGGVLVRLTQNGEVQYSMSLDHSTAVQYYDGMLAISDLVQAWEFNRLAANATVATIDQVKANVSQTRELSATVEVPYLVIGVDELRDRYQHALDDEDRADMHVEEAVLKLLGAIEPGADLETLYDDLHEEQVSGFYSPSEKSFYLVERGESSTGDQLTIVHEYVHALQDQHFDLQALQDNAANSDQALAIRALAEGDATLAMLLYADEFVPVYDMMEAVAEIGGVEETTLDASPAFIRESELFPYIAGLEFISTLHDRGEWPAVDAAYEKLPESTEQILHPERYRQGDSPVDVTLPDLAGALERDWQEVDRDVMGELGLRLFLEEHAGPAMARLAAEGWGGDSYVVLHNSKDGSYLLAMVTEWDDQEEADQFQMLLRCAMDHRTGSSEIVADLIGEPEDYRWQAADTTLYARQDGDRVLIVIGPDDQSVDAAAAEF